MYNVVTTVEGNATAKKAASATVAAKFQTFLGNLLCRYPCYRVLHKFLPFFDRLVALAGGPEAFVESPQIKLERMIAMTVDKTTNKASLPTAALSFKHVAVDQQDATEFLSCALFTDYVTAVTENRLEEAKQEKDPKKCYATLATLNKLPSLPAAWRSKISIGMAVFDSSTTKATQVRYILQNETAADLVYDWWPKGTYATCVRLATQPEAVKLAELAWDDFREALELLIEAGQIEAVDHNDYSPLLVVVSSTTQGGTLPPWASAILRETCGLARSGVRGACVATRQDAVRGR